MITKQQAATLYAYDYKLQDKEGKKWGIVGVLEGIILLYGSKVNDDKYISFDQIGTDYKILCRPFSDLTKEIKGIGVPIVELAKINRGENIEINDYGMSIDGSFYYCEIKNSNKLRNIIFDEYGDFHHTLVNYIEPRFNGTQKITEQEALFNWLDAHHFLRGVEPENLIYIE